MLCNNCRNPLEEDSNFCTTCGVAVVSSPEANPNMQSPLAKQGQAWSRKRTLLALATVFILSVTSFLGYSIYVHYNAPKPKTEVALKSQTTNKPQKQEPKKDTTSKGKSSVAAVPGTYSNPAGSWVFTLDKNGIIFDKETKKIGNWRIDKDMVVLTYSFDNIINYITLADLVEGKKLINVRNNKKWKGQIHKTK